MFRLFFAPQYEYHSYEGVVKNCKMFDYMKKWKSEGKIKHIGFSFHDSAEVLDKILSEHPEVEVAQIVVNYLDWESYYIQSKKCYETIREHGKKVLIMKPVKGGALAKVPEEVEKIFKTAEPKNSVAFCRKFGRRCSGNFWNV